MKTYLIGLALMLALCLQGEGRSTAHAAGTALVESHAYLFLPPAPTQDYPVPINYVDVIILQAGKIRYLGCGDVEDSDIPHTPESLTSLVTGPNCRKIDEHPDLPKLVIQDRIVHQKIGDRYIYISAILDWYNDTYPSTGIIASSSSSLTAFFEPSNTSSLNLVVAGVEYVAGKNPDVYTRRITELKGYEATIQYPEITEAPIEQ